MGISINGPSGIDTAYIIDSLVQLEVSTRVTPAERQKAAYDVKIEAYTRFQALVADIGSKSFALSTLSAFSLFSQQSSNDKLLTLTGGTGGQAGSYSVNVFHTATAEKMISANGLVTSQTASLSSLGITTGTIKVDGAEIAVDDNDTIQDLRMKINNATTPDGKKIGVTATVIKMADNNFRLVLTAKDTGDEGVAYEDVTGSTLQGLGIIQSAAGDKGIAAQQLTSAASIQAAYDALAVGGTMTFAGVDHDGNEATGTFVKTAGSTIDDFLDRVEQSYHGMVDAAIDGSGMLTLTDKIGGDSQLSMTSLSVGGVAQQMNITTAGDAGDGVLAMGTNAYFSVDGLLLESSTNNAEGFIQGVTLNLKKASADETVTVNIGRDYDAIVGKIQKLVDAYNAMLKFQKEETKYANPEDKKSSKGDLAGDMTVGAIVGQFRTLLQKQYGQPGGEYDRMLDIGLSTDYTTGEYKVDATKLKAALEDNFDDVVNLFVTAGTSENGSITYGRSTKDTASNAYELRESGGITSIRVQGTATWYDGTRSGEIVTFGDGPAKGLSITMAAGTIAEGSTVAFTYSRSLSDSMKDLTDNLSDSYSGLIAMRQQSYRRSIDLFQDRIDRLNDSIDKYKERLVKQFSAMEQTMSQLQGQSSNMLSAIGGLTIYNR